MLRNSKASLLARFQFSPSDFNTDILITCCPKTVFSVHHDLDRVVSDMFVVYRNNRWHLVDSELYGNGVYIEGLLRADIYDCVDIDGNRFLLVSTYPLSGDITSWRESVLDVVDVAREHWVKMSKSGNGYEAQIMDNIHYAPRWSRLPMVDFVLEAFGDHVIMAENFSTSVPAYQQTVRNSRNVREDF
jgi:hypothetical protein